ncbi:hypothetical protein PanWU01x14_043120 [Parasponia andersonii]|uniref:Uncharacterized protein n=1 Tax=Parasponia andersonii TaxID=3476 RepID=A0A2P5DPX9_PARAD|nr:hypothetical protein PanWU01x14_043120 [Parasponia andersonii]
MLLILSFEIELGVKLALWPRSRVAAVLVLYREKESGPKRLPICVWALLTSCTSQLLALRLGTLPNLTLLLGRTSCSASGHCPRAAHPGVHFLGGCCCRIKYLKHKNSAARQLFDEMLQ